MSSLSSTVPILLLSASAAWVFTRCVIPLLRSKAIDVPNIRSSHRVPTPRGGGVGIAIGVVFGLLAGWFLEGAIVNWRLLLATALIAAAGLAEDLVQGLPIFLRLAIQVLAAAIIVFPGEGFSHLPLPEPFNLNLGIAGIPLAMLWLVGVTNIFNFLDGIDGFAASQGLLAGLVLGAVSVDKGLAIAAFAVGGGCAGFLFHNWHPAKVFMGDVGSSMLGFLLAALPLQEHVGAQSRMVFLSAMCLWFFLSDSVFTMLRRLRRGEKVWEAHRSHLYQRLVITGLHHDEVVVPIMAGAAILSSVALASWWLDWKPLELIALGLALMGFLAYLRWTCWRETHFGGPSED